MWIHIHIRLVGADRKVAVTQITTSYNNDEQKKTKHQNAQHMVSCCCNPFNSMIPWDQWYFWTVGDIFSISTAAADARTITLASTAWIHWPKLPCVKNPGWLGWWYNGVEMLSSLVSQNTRLDCHSASRFDITLTVVVELLVLHEKIPLLSQLKGKDY